MQRVPADLRDLQFGGDGPLHGNDGPGDESQAFVFPVFIALVEQELHAEADAHQRLSLCRQFADEVRETGGKQALLRVPERADARQEQFVRRAKTLGVRGDLHLVPQGLQR